METPTPDMLKQASHLAIQQGVGFFADPAQLDLPVLGASGVIDRLRHLPRDETVMLLARLSCLLHALGETTQECQRAFVESWLQEPTRSRALEWLDAYPNGVIVTYEASVRLSLMAMAHGDADSCREPTDDDVRALIEVLPEVQAWLSRFPALPGAPAPPPASGPAETAFTLFLVANAPGMSTSPSHAVMAAALGSLAAQWTTRELAKRRGRAARQVLVDNLGCDLSQAHAAAINLANTFLHTAGEEEVQHLIARTATSASQPIAKLVDRMAGLATTSRPPDDTDPHRLLGPKSVLPPGLRGRPFHERRHTPGLLACWDVRLLFRMLGGRFPRWLEPLYAEHQAAFDTLSSSWDLGIEHALDALIRPVLPTWKKPPKTGKKNCDRCFEVDGHLFLVEIKNVKPGEALSTGTAHHFQNWLRDKFFRKDGFPQIDATAAALDATRNKPYQRKIRRYKAIWPVVLCWTRLPGHPRVTDLLVELQAEKPRPLDDRLLRRMQAPLVLDYYSFLSVAAAVPALATRGVSLSELFESYLGQRTLRTLLMPQHARALAGPHEVPSPMTAVMEEALRVQADAVRRLEENDFEQP